MMHPMTTTPAPAPATSAAAEGSLTAEVLDSCPTLGELLEVLGEVDRLNARAVRLVDQLQTSGEAEALTGLPLELWLSVQGRQVRSDRRMLATAAEMLERLPSLREAFAAGQVSWGQVRAVVLATLRLPTHLHDRIDAQLAATIPALADAEPDALVHAVGRAIDAQDPGPDDQAGDRDRQERFLALQPRLDGSGGSVYGEYDAVGFAVLDAWFAADPPRPIRTRDKVGELGDDERRETNRRSTARWRADRLIERLAGDLPGGGELSANDAADGAADGADANAASGDRAASGDGPDADRADTDNAHAAGDGPTGRARPRPTLLLRLPYESLLDGEVPGDLLTTLTGGRLRLSARASRELLDAGGADLRSIIIDQSGEVLGVGRRTRVPPGWLRDARLALDSTCTAPGCQVAARNCHLDHGHRWEDGGPTDVANLSHLCATDNHARERDGWDAVGASEGSRRWFHRRTGLHVRHVPETWRPPPVQPDASGREPPTHRSPSGREPPTHRSPSGREPPTARSSPGRQPPKLRGTPGQQPPEGTSPPAEPTIRDPAFSEPPVDPTVPF